MKTKNVFLFGFPRYLNWGITPLKPATIKADAYDMGGTALVTNVGTSANELTGVYIQVPEWGLPALAILHGYRPEEVKWVGAKSSSGTEVVVAEPTYLPKITTSVITTWPTEAGNKYWGV